MKTRIAVLLVLFIGYIGYSVSLPIFPVLILDPEHTLNGSSNLGSAILLGCLIAIYPLGQFFGAPLIGKLSDKYGRRIVLLITLLAIIPAHLLTGLIIEWKNLTGLFVIRLLCGLLEGNIVIGQATMADINESTSSKAKSFGWITAVVSSAFIFGPLIGGYMGNRWGFASPFYLAAALALLSFFAVLAFFVETRVPNHAIRVRLRDAIMLFVRNFQRPRLGYVFFFNFLFYMGIMLFFSFISAYLLRVFHFNVSMIGFANAYLSIPIALTPLFIKTVHYPRRAMGLAGLFFSLSLLVLIFPSTPYALYFTLIPTGVFAALGFTFGPLIVSSLVDEHTQGEALGVNQSVLVFAESLAGITGGCLLSVSSASPLILGALFTFLCALATLPQHRTK